MGDWENMVDFAKELIKHASKHRTYDIIDQRIVIINLDHAIELLMKAFLIKEGYIISYLEKNDVKAGIKKESIQNIDKTIDYVDCITLISKLVKFTKNKKETLLKFHKLRNEIQHRATNIPLDKVEEIILFLPVLEELCYKMFPEEKNNFAHIFLE